jgi:hypothetical protein
MERLLPPIGMTVEQLEANCGYHQPDFQEEAAEAFGRRPRPLLAGAANAAL